MDELYLWQLMYFLDILESSLYFMVVRDDLIHF